MVGFTTLGNLFHNICCKRSMWMLLQGWSGTFYLTFVPAVFKNKHWRLNRYLSIELLLPWTVHRQFFPYKINTGFLQKIYEFRNLGSKQVIARIFFFFLISIHRFYREQSGPLQFLRAWNNLLLPQLALLLLLSFRTLIVLQLCNLFCAFLDYQPLIDKQVCEKRCFIKDQGGTK